MDDPRYPIGPYHSGPAATAGAQREALAQMAKAPAELRAAVAGLSNVQLDTPYREAGWTVRQVVHHLADAHLNWYARAKLALTENEPAIKPYDQERWADLEDARAGPIEPSLALVEALHERWVRLLECLPPEAWSRRFFHPERGWLTLAEIPPQMAWHARHHTAQITELRRRMHWSG